MTKTDRETKRWIRNAADERAAADGMRFDAERGQFVCDWIENYCCLYEGAKAGEPLKLLAWQRDFVMRLFGWVQWSEDWGEWVRRFNRASLWAAKKNGKSPFLAALGLYLLAGDGEQGQKVYAAAKNGEQAKIAQRHAMMMVEQSPALADDCKVNKSTLQITHMPSRSIMMVLTGDNSAGAKAKEGINGSVLIDECHVFDREMHERTSRAGISRKEPLNLAVSTAGDDPSSYGFERAQYGRQVNSGTRLDHGFLHVEYAAPDGLTDAEIDKNLEKYAESANPSWREIVKPKELREDWESCKGKPREVARFKQYRLNVWVGSTNQWLDTAGWQRGKRAISREELMNRPCYLGLDLSRTRDMTSAVFLFPWDESDDSLFVWPKFWLPESTANARDHLFPFRSWASAGEIDLTPGEVVDYSAVESAIVAEAQELQLQVRGLYFDQHYAEELSQRLSNALGCERIAVPQSLMTLSPLCKEFERRVSSGQILHDGNAVLAWQVGHCEVWADRNENVRPVKPKPLSGKSIDGIMAAIDAMAGVCGDSGMSQLSEATITFI